MMADIGGDPEPAERPKLLYLVTEDWYFVSHRLPLALAAKNAGYDVSVATNVGRDGAAIESAGLRLLPIEFSRSSVHPLEEAATVRSLVSLYLSEMPDLVHHVALKPVVYGSIAARIAGVEHVVNALMGLGYVFSSDTAKAQVLRPFVELLLRAALRHPSSRTIVQNRDDAALLAARRIAARNTIRLIRGSGVDPARYTTAPPPAGEPLVILPARLLRDKGVMDFAEAARRLKTHGIKARFALVGAPDPGNPASVSEAEVQALVRAGIVEHWGWRTDMPRVLAETSIVCLPTSYGEGLPKALLEAAASTRAIVATDISGCREIVRPGVNGWLVPPRDAAALTGALGEALANPDLCLKYGKAGRALVEQEFSIAEIVRQTLSVYGELVAPAREAS
jgi:glycosyltransferase involved in cell wall biosynthesis